MATFSDSEHPLSKKSAEMRMLLTNKNNRIMALQWKWTDKMGKMAIKQKEKTFDVNIYAGNALAIFICEYEQDGEQRYILYNFFADKAHCDNIIRNGKRLFTDEVVSVEINLYHKSAQTLLNIFVKNGYKVLCYYEKPKQ